MDHLFDEFSKSLAEPVLRRESLRRLGAVFAGALLGPLFGQQTAAADQEDRTKHRGRGRRPDPRIVSRRRGAGQPNACTAFCKRCRTQKQQNQCLTACRACSNDPNRLNGACGNYVCCHCGNFANVVLASLG